MSIQPASKLVLAIDPGSSGGYAYKLSGSASVVAGNLPDNDADTVSLLSELSEQADDLELVIEAVSSFGGVKNAASMSKLFGGKRFIEGVAMALQYRIVNVQPQKWQQHFALGKRSGCSSDTEWKNKLKSEAAKRFPKIKVTLKISDALLLLEFALNTQSCMTA